MSQELQIYQARLDISPIEVDRLWRFLSEDERSRANQFKRAHLKRNFVAARGNLRELLARWLGCEPQEIRFNYSDRGKPYLQNLSPFEEIYFNLAHSQDLALYVLSRHSAVGIDLEYINPNCDVMGIAGRYFLPSEQKIISALGDRQQQQLAFYRLWTLKEAYGKATGQGIVNLLDAIDVSLCLERPLGEVLEIAGWSLNLLNTEEIAIDPSYAAALCKQANRE